MEKFFEIHNKLYHSCDKGVNAVITTWTNYTISSGLGSSITNSVFVKGDTIYVGTE